MLGRIRRRPPQSVIDGSKALRDGRLEDAERHFRETIDAGHESSASWFDLALAQKLQHHWADAEASNLRAIDLDPKNKEAIWNLGVVATALRHWNQSRWCWRQLGFEPTNDSGPPTGDYGINAGPSEPGRRGRGGVGLADRCLSGPSALGTASRVRPPLGRRHPPRCRSGR